MVMPSAPGVHVNIRVRDCVAYRFVLLPSSRLVGRPPSRGVEEDVVGRFANVNVHKLQPLPKDLSDFRKCSNCGRSGVGTAGMSAIPTSDDRPGRDAVPATTAVLSVSGT